MESYDIIIIGGGPGGYETAVEACRMGRRVALVERDQLGGTCLNRGCIPTKTLARSAEVARTLAEAARFGISGCGTPAIDMEAIMARKAEVVDTLRQGVASLLAGVEIYRGEASLDGPGRVNVSTGAELSAGQVIIATGSAPSQLPVPGAEHAITSDQMLELTHRPDSLIVIGGGVVGVEFASIYAAFGTEVTLVEYCQEILPQFDAEVAKRLRMALKRRGIRIETGVEVTSIGQDHTVTVRTRRGEKQYSADCVLMAVGRRPVIPAGVAEAGVRIGRRGIEVDPDTMATNIPGIYAIGDVNGLMMLAHAAVAQGRAALGLTGSRWPVPAAVFSMPEAAMAGETEESLKASGRAYGVGRAYFRSSGKAMAEGETDGMVKVLTDTATGRLAGAHIVGPHAADLIQELSLAMSAGLEATEVAGAIHAHPTLSEVVMEAVRAAVDAE